MKKFTLFFATMLFFSAFTFAQAKKTINWKEMTDFETLMNKAIQPVKLNKFDAVKENAPELYRSSKILFASASESRFTNAETMKTMENLMIRCNDLWAAVHNKQSNDKIKAITTDVQSLYKKATADIKQ